MSLITVNADLGRVADALERIAKAVEDHVYQPVRKPPEKPADLDDYSRITDDDILARQVEDAIRMQSGLPSYLSELAHAEETKSSSGTAQADEAAG